MHSFRIVVKISEDGKILERFPVEKTLAESVDYIADGNYHEVCMSIPIDPEGRILLIKRNNSRKVYPGRHSTPAGHVEWIENAEGSFIEDAEKTVLRELREETGIISATAIKILENVTLIDSDAGHLGYAFLVPVDKDVELKLCMHEIDVKSSSFIDPEHIKTLLIQNPEDFTPIAGQMFSAFFKEYGAEKSYIRALRAALTDIEQ